MPSGSTCQSHVNIVHGEVYLMRPELYFLGSPRWSQSTNRTVLTLCLLILNCLSTNGEYIFAQKQNRSTTLEVDLVCPELYFLGSPLLAEMDGNLVLGSDHLEISLNGLMVHRDLVPAG